MVDKYTKFGITSCAPDTSGTRHAPGTRGPLVEIHRVQFLKDGVNLLHDVAHQVAHAVDSSLKSGLDIDIVFSFV